MSPSRKIGAGSGPRPAPLKIHRDSHLIHKPSPSSSSSFSSASSPTDSDISNNNNQQQRRPVIIYTHSPKIIHTQAQDFMALVQKLTGLSRSDDDDEGAPVPPQEAQQHQGSISRSDDTVPRRTPARNVDGPSFSPEDNNYGLRDVHGGQLRPPAVFDPPPNHPFLSDIPLFTPNPSDLFCLPRHTYYSYPNAVFSPPNVGSSISPSLMEVMKPFHEY